MKRNIDYYPHRTEAHRHPKFRMLRSIFGNGAEGWAAEGRFWALNNLIASAEDCKLDLRKRRNKGVFADELGMSIEEFEQFIDVLTSEDVELLTEIEAGIYTTEMVSETYSAILTEREKARAKKRKSSKNTSSAELPESSPEKLKSSPEPDNKVNKSKGKGIEGNKIKEKLSFFTPKLSSLFASRTPIKNPNLEKHIEPILEILSNVPEKLSVDDVWECVEETFEKFNAEHLRMDYFVNNINGCVARKREQVLKEEKQAVLREAQADREQEAVEKREKIKNIRQFYERNKDKMTPREKTDFEKALNAEQLLMAESLYFAISERMPIDVTDSTAKNVVKEGV